MTVQALVEMANRVDLGGAYAYPDLREALLAVAVEGREKAVQSLQIAARAHMHAMLKVLVENAKKGNTTAATRVLEFGFGKPIQSVEMKVDESLLNKRLSEMTPDELAAFEAKLKGMGVGEPEQGDMFGSGATRGH